MKHEISVNNYELKETIVGLIGEWFDKDTELDRREDIEFELPPLVHKLWELEPKYKAMKTEKMYNELAKEITK